MRYYSEVSTEEIVERYKMPIQTVSDWSEQDNYEECWEGALIDTLKTFLIIEKENKARLKSLFTKTEMQALWGCFRSTIFDSSFVEMPEYLKYGFEDYCKYEQIEAQQFGNTEELCKDIFTKLDTLNSFDRFCLLEFLQKDKKEIFNEN